MVEIAFICVIGGLLLFIGYQMRVIERLTDKVMAKDYNEYKQLERPPKIEDIPLHKPQSWADNIPVDDED